MRGKRIWKKYDNSEGIAELCNIEMNDNPTFL